MESKTLRSEIASILEAYRHEEQNDALFIEGMSQYFSDILPNQLNIDHECGSIDTFERIIFLKSGGGYCSICGKFFVF